MKSAVLNLFSNFLKFVKEHQRTVLFLFFVFVYLIFGFCFNFYNDKIVQAWNGFTFGMDTGRGYEYFTSINPWGTNYAHPLIPLSVAPVFYFVKGIFASTRASAISVLPVVASLNIVMLFSLLKKLTNNTRISLLTALVYGFGFSTIIFSTLFENYIFSAFFNFVLLFYAISIKDNNKKLTNIEIFTLALLTIFSFGINLINVVTCLFIVVFVVFLKRKDIKSFLINILKYIFVFAVLCTTLVSLQKFSYGTRFFTGAFSFENGKITHNAIERWGDKEASIEKIKTVFQYNLVMPFYCLKLKNISKPRKAFWDYRKDLNNTSVEKQEYYYVPVWLKDKCNPSHFIIASIFLLMHIVFYIKQNKKIQNKSIIKLLFSIVCLNIMFNYFFDVNEGFLFSQNFFIFLVLLLGLVASNVKNKYIEYIYGGFVVFLVYKNCHYLMKIKKILSLNMTNHYSFFRYIFFAFIVTLFFGFLIYLFKKIIKKDLLPKNELKFTILANSYLIYCVVFSIFAWMFAGRL